MGLLPKHAHRRKKLGLILMMVIGVGVAVGMVTMALKENINLFFSPTQVLAGEAPQDRTIRIGGMVRTGSVQRSNTNLEVAFDVTDTAKNLRVVYTGILPDLFREGQGIVAQGKVGADGTFIASEVLAKHDENYMPPEAAEAIKNAQKLQATVKE